MPARIPLIERNLVNTGVRVARTAQLSNGQEGEAWGQALQNIGKELGEFAKEREKANDATTMIDLEGKMRAITSAQMQFQNDNPDQELWSKNWDELTKGFEENDLKKARLSSDARITMSSTFGRFSQGQALSIQEAANGQAKRRGVLSTVTRAEEGAKVGDDASIHNAGRIALANNVMLPEEWNSRLPGLLDQSKAVRRGQTQDSLKALAVQGDVEGIDLMLSDESVSKDYSADEITILKDQWTNQARSKQMEDQVLEEVATDPEGAVMRLEARDDKGNFTHYPELSQTQRNMAADLGRREQQKGYERNASQLYESVVGGQVRNVSDLSKEPYLSQFSKLPPSYKASVEKLLTDGAITDPAEYERMKSAIEGADLTDDLKIANLQRQFLLFPKQEQALLSKRLTDRQNSGEKTPRSIADLYQEIDGDLASGVFGNFRVTGDKIKISEDGEAVKVTSDSYREWGMTWIGPTSIPTFTTKAAAQAPIKLSESDKLRLSTMDADKKASVIIEDQAAKREASVKVSQMKAELEKLQSSGATVEELRVKYYEMTNNPRLEEARTLINSPSAALFPTPEQLTLPQSIEELLKANGR